MLPSRGAFIKLLIARLEIKIGGGDFVVDMMRLAVMISPLLISVCFSAASSTPSLATSPCIVATSMLRACCRRCGGDTVRAWGGTTIQRHCVHSALYWQSSLVKGTQREGDTILTSIGIRGMACRLLLLLWLRRCRGGGGIIGGSGWLCFFSTEASYVCWLHGPLLRLGLLLERYRRSLSRGIWMSTAGSLSSNRKDQS
jgi:hypothetical protein